MTPLPADIETDPRFPSGKWVGFWTQPPLYRGKQGQEMALTFSQGSIAGEGRDRIGKFHIRGFYSTEDGMCRWTKKYVGKHEVFYKGFNEGKGIWGVWEIPPSQNLGLNWRGGFHIWPEGMPDPTGDRLSEEADVPSEALELVTADR
jgi:hypothetical protein